VLQVYGDPSAHGNSGITGAMQNAYERAPHTFLVTGITFILALQLISLGVVAAQAKRYYEELYHLGTSIRRRLGDGSERRDASGAHPRNGPD
jgi:hypothetical protein